MFTQGYRKVKKERPKTEENEIHITSKGMIRGYLGYGMRVLTKTDHKELIITSSGNSTVKMVILIEILKGLHGNLH